MANDVYSVVCLALVAGCMTLAVHPLLRHLKLSELLPALLVACTGRLNRRRLAFILRTRHASYLADLEGVPRWHQLAAGDLVSRWDKLAAALGLPWRHTAQAPLPPEKKLATVAHCMVHGPASPGIRPRAEVVPIRVTAEEDWHSSRAEVVPITDRDYNRGESGDWRDRLPAGRNPWAAQIAGELARHRKRGLNDDERWARLEANWQDIDPARGRPWPRG